MKIITITLLILISVILVSCVPAAEQCSVDADCAPAQCCHPLSAVNKASAPDCGGTLCTSVCEGPLDCGQGEIKCVSNRCTVVALQ